MLQRRPLHARLVLPSAMAGLGGGKQQDGYFNALSKCFGTLRMPCFPSNNSLWFSLDVAVHPGPVNARENAWLFLSADNCKQDLSDNLDSTSS